MAPVPKTMGNGNRMHLILCWARALTRGYETHNGVIQPPTSGNITACILRDDAMKQWIGRRYDRWEMHDPWNSGLYDKMRAEFAQPLSVYGRRGLLDKTEIERSEKTSIKCRRRGVSRHGRPPGKYEINNAGINRIEFIEQCSEQKIRGAELCDEEIPMSVYKIPVEEKYGWRLEEIRVPSTNSRGICYETDINLMEIARQKSTTYV